MKAAIFYLSAFGALLAASGGVPGIFAAYQVVMWAMFVLMAISSIATLCGNATAIKARKSAKPSSMPSAISSGLMVGLAVATALVGAPALGGVMIVLLMIDIAARQELEKMEKK